ncbi:MAG: hypothetical protein IIA59_01370 [Candidatus Marinimicrobia bacterium]|nr:hypothetical protein [Candidatus Neomarinimicrobiota bacterium]
MGKKDDAGPEEGFRQVYEGFDDYCQQFIRVIDPKWDASTRMFNIEYCLFLYGAALAIARGTGREDGYSAVLWAPYLSLFMDLEDSTKWALKCEKECSKSVRLQEIRAAGNNTAQAVFYAGSHGRSGDLNTAENMNFLLLVFSELSKHMKEASTSGQGIVEASSLIYDSIVNG